MSVLQIIVSLRVATHSNYCTATADGGRTSLHFGGSHQYIPRKCKVREDYHCDFKLRHTIGLRTLINKDMADNWLQQIQFWALP